jgi:hypothetical protein
VALRVSQGFYGAPHDPSESCSTGGELKGHLNVEFSFKNSTARFYVASVLLALEHVHGLGYVYRDIKPENLLLDKRGYLKMVDFGLAKRISTGRTFTVCGTREYQVCFVKFMSCVALPVSSKRHGVSR